MPVPPEIPDRVLQLLRAAYAAPVAPGSLTLLNQGKYGNANVYRYSEGPRDLVIKEFYSRSGFIRTTLGRFFIRREARALVDLEGIAGIPPGGRRLGPAALAEAFLDGETLVQLHRVRQIQLPKSFFLDLERLVDEMHQAGYAHLDLRNLGNLICGRDGRPYILDFQSCMRTARWPRFVRRIMENSDRSGIYKCWLKLCAEPLDSERAAFMDRFSGTRKFWIFKGYWFTKTWKRLTRRKPS
jgi:predicted Ser/Thr protein kinase